MCLTFCFFHTGFYEAIPSYRNDSRQTSQLKILQAKSKQRTSVFLKKWNIVSVESPKHRIKRKDMFTAALNIT